MSDRGVCRAALDTLGLLNIRTKGTGFICGRTGFIHRWTGFICVPVCRQIKPVCLRIKPIRQVLIFYLFFLSNFFAFCQQRGYYHQNQCDKVLILRSYVDFLNYPFKDVPGAPLSPGQDRVMEEPEQTGARTEGWPFSVKCKTIYIVLLLYIVAFADLV